MVEIRSQIQSAVTMIDFISSKRRVCLREGLESFIWTSMVNSRMNARMGATDLTLKGFVSGGNSGGG
jgi:hypothetical protein